MRTKREARAWQRMLSGRRLDLLDPSPLDVEIEDIAWLLGIDEDVMNQDIRCAEVRNWIDLLVLPTMRR